MSSDLNNNKDYIDSNYNQIKPFKEKMSTNNLSIDHVIKEEDEPGSDDEIHIKIKKDDKNSRSVDDYKYK